jgi:hypothetical protein
VHDQSHLDFCSQVAGLDVGWHNPLEMTWNTKKHRFELERLMYPGNYQVGRGKGFLTFNIIISLYTQMKIVCVWR